MASDAADLEIPLVCVFQISSQNLYRDPKISLVVQGWKSKNRIENIIVCHILQWQILFHEDFPVLIIHGCIYAYICVYYFTADMWELGYNVNIFLTMDWVLKF